MRLRSDGYRPMIEAAYSMLPGSLAQRLAHVHFLTGVDPTYVGLHADAAPLSDDASGITFYAHHQEHLSADQRHPTIWLNSSLVRYQHSPLVVLHELGHVLHEATDWRHCAAVLTRYAEIDWCEAFAEAFVIWAVGWEPYMEIGGQHAPWYIRPDAVTCAVLEGLAG